MGTKTAKEKKEKYVSAERFEALEESVSQLVDLFKKAQAPVAPPAPAPAATTPVTAAVAAQEKAIKDAKPDLMPVPPSWAEKAQELLGDFLDHVEIQYPRGGGSLFTVVIKKEKSNASPEYLAMYKTDRRTKEIGNEGIEGVENFCKLVKQNLARPR